MRLIALAIASVLLVAAQPNSEPKHLTFSLVRGTAGYMPTTPGGGMSDAPYIVLAFTSEGGHKSLVITDNAGDYTAVLLPGHYCLTAYYVKTGDLAPLDAKQLKCIDVSNGKDVRLDVMLANRNAKASLR